MVIPNPLWAYHHLWLPPLPTVAVAYAEKG
jgi:hypothetical protein